MFDAIRRVAANYATSAVCAVVFCWLVAPHVVIANLQLLQQAFSIPRANIDFLERLIAVLWALGTLVLAIGAIVCLIKLGDSRRKNELPDHEKSGVRWFKESSLYHSA